MKLCGVDIIISGKLLRIARPELEKYEPLDNPEAIIDKLRMLSERVDLFTFLQIEKDVPSYDYLMEWDNLAVLPVSAFDYWFSKQIRSEARNRSRQAEKKGVRLGEVAFDDTLVKGILGSLQREPDSPGEGKCPLRERYQYRSERSSNFPGPQYFYWCIS